MIRVFGNLLRFMGSSVIYMKTDDKVHCIPHGTTISVHTRSRFDEFDNASAR